MPDDPPPPESRDWSRVHEMRPEPPEPLWLRVGSYATLIVFLAAVGAGIGFVMPYLFAGASEPTRTAARERLNERIMEDTTQAMRQRAILGAVSGGVLGGLGLAGYHAKQYRDQKLKDF